MKIARILALLSICFTACTLRAQDAEAPRVGGTGRITEITADPPHKITAEMKSADGTKSVTFNVPDNCKIVTDGLGAYGELKKGDNIKIEYVEKPDGVREIVDILVVNAPAKTATKPTTKTAPATTKPAAKKPAAKKPAAKKPAAK